MEKHTEQLSEQVKDALTELGNIGAGNATTSLSVLLSSKLSMSAPPATWFVQCDDLVCAWIRRCQTFVRGVAWTDTGLAQRDGNVCDWRNREHPDRFVRCIVREPVRDGAKVLPAADLY